jgi:hypothetical protein
MSYKQQMLEHQPNAVCCIAPNRRGYHVWIRGHDPRFLGSGCTPRAAWRDALYRNTRYMRGPL